MIKKIVIISVLTALLGQSVPLLPVNAQSPNVLAMHYYEDLSKSHWAAKDLVQLIEMGVLDGPTNGKIKPNEMVSRAETIAVIARATGVSLESNFPLKAKDVPVSHPYYKEIRKMAELGVIHDDAWMYPGEPVQRDQISKILSLAFKIEIDQKNKASFIDIPKKHWAKDYVESLADTGIIKGVTTKEFSPRTNVTRAQLAQLTMRGIQFTEQLSNYNLVYDYLAKDYITTTSVHKNWSNLVVKYINEIRVSKGLNPLTQDPALNQLAIIKAQDMIKRRYFDHTSPFYGDPWDMATLFDYEYVSFAENLARNFKTPEQTVDAWLASPSHRKNLLNAHYTTTGIGVKQANDGNLYIVNLFAKK
ncbi:S-layer homology domain-containing protein [Solibacillus sp. R5-41]|uniref:CAP and S-layer homology domain-containing protein n=1 Tax=Solibacillus sp. R5-41 TaxID=2048654 RepID=UPI001561E5B9|nr:S-layer homology domain-containing protein [Solibacillus sp. R5-41]